MTTFCSRAKQAGFTLVELLVVVAIVGILAAVAVPAYQDSVRKSKRADAMASLEALAQAMEQYYSANYTYENAATGGADTGAPEVTVFSYSTTPKEGGTPAYNLRITAATVNSYELEAQPLGTQVNDDCGTLQIDNTGDKSSTGSGLNCW